jgi:serine/threonine protein kinase
MTNGQPPRPRPSAPRIPREDEPASSRGDSGVRVAPSASETGPSPALADPFGLVGTTQLDTYRIEYVEAHGGFSVVYRAMHLALGHVVALKCLRVPPQMTAQEQADFVDRFIDEGEVMTRLSAMIPEIARPLELGSFSLGGRQVVPFIALEWLEGETLKARIVRRLRDGLAPMSLPEVLERLSPVAHALSRAHRLPTPNGPLAVLHCDLKPDNLFVVQGPEGETIKIFDFGIAKVRSALTREAGGATSAAQGPASFTPAYAAPEQWMPDRFGQTGAWTDVYALALVVTELLTQRPALDGKPAQILAGVLDPKKRPSPRRLGLETSDELEQALVRAVAVDPRERTATVDELWAALCACPEAAPVSRRAPVGSAPSSDLEPTPAPSSPPAHEPPMTHVPPSGSAPPAAASPSVGFDGELDLQLPSPSPGAGPLELETSTQGATFSQAAPSAASDLDVSLPEGGLAGLELAEEPARPERPAPATPPSKPSATGVGPIPGLDQLGALGGDTSDLGEVVPPAPPSQRERLQAVAQVAAAKASKAATVAASTAASAAKQVATKALEVDERHRIVLEDPSTWWRPMLGPIVGIAAAMLVTLGAVIANRFSKGTDKISVTWVSLVLFTAAIGFAVYRWRKITERDED